MRTNLVLIVDYLMTQGKFVYRTIIPNLEEKKCRVVACVNPLSLIHLESWDSVTFMPVIKSEAKPSILVGWQLHGFFCETVLNSGLPPLRHVTDWIILFYNSVIKSPFVLFSKGKKIVQTLIIVLWLFVFSENGTYIISLDVCMNSLLWTSSCGELKPWSMVRMQS